MLKMLISARSTLDEGLPAFPAERTASKHFTEEVAPDGLSAQCSQKR
jgi:hypothetical protein